MNARPIQEWRQGEYLISTEKSRLDMDVIHRFLSKSYWAQGIPREVVEQSIEQSLPFGIYKGEQQVGFARVITDYATFAYLGDVFVLEDYRGLGLSKWLMQVVVEHPTLQGLRRWMLLTSDAHGLYRTVGFTGESSDLLATPGFIAESISFVSSNHRKWPRAPIIWRGLT